MNRNKEFIKNTIILFLGKFTTQFISLLLLPLFTHFLLTEDFGIVDLLQTYITLFVPILTLRLDSATFRFLIDKRKDDNSQKNIISNIMLLLVITLLITISIGLFLVIIINVKYKLYVLLNLLILMVSNVLLQLLRGLGKNKEYSIASILTGLITLTINCVLIIGFAANASSILISSSVANFICILYVIWKTNLFAKIETKLINKTTIKELLAYSCPMIPNALSWWIVNVSDRTIISIFLGSSFNGIYSVSCKFSNIINSIFSIFNMSWQETAVLHIEDKDKDEFFSNMIDKLLMLFSATSLLIIAVLPFVYNWIIGVDYHSSYKFIPILLYANLWSILINLIGGIYVAKKKTKEIAITTLISSILNIVINLIFIKVWGLYAACISTLVAYMAMGIYRYFDCKKYVNVKLNIKNYIFFSILFIWSSMAYINNNVYINILNLILILMYIFTSNRENIKSIVYILKKTNN